MAAAPRVLMTPTERRPGLRAAVVDGRGRPLGLRALSSWLERAAPRRTRGALCIAIVSDGTVRSLNGRYRRHNASTDVLSFPSDPSDPSSLIPPPSALAESYLGDVVIARGVARRQARAAGHSELTELRILALHGLLHLLGYDHERDNGQMARLEERLRRRAGLRSPGLVERAGGAGRAGRAGQAGAPAAIPSRGHEDPRRGISVSSRRGWGPAASDGSLGVGPRGSRKSRQRRS
jgi:probable rRNA maturation factor